MRRERQRREIGRPDPGWTYNWSQESKSWNEKGAQSKPMGWEWGDSKRITTNLLEHLVVYKVITHITFCLHCQPHRDTGPDQGATRKDPTEVGFKGARMLRNMKKKKTKGKEGRERRLEGRRGGGGEAGKGVSSSNIKDPGVTVLPKPTHK